MHLQIASAISIWSQWFKIDDDWKICVFDFLEREKILTNMWLFTLIFFRTVSNACHNKLAKQRLSSLLELGYFNVSGIEARRNTIVVSASEKILIHIERSISPRFDLWLRIERISSLDHRLARNRSGLIYHYQK